MEEKDKEALDKFNAFVKDNNIKLRISNPSLVPTDTGIGFGVQNIVVGYNPPEKTKKDSEPAAEETPK